MDDEKKHLPFSYLATNPSHFWTNKNGDLCIATFCNVESPEDEFTLVITNWRFHGPKDLTIFDRKGEICSIKNLAHLRGYGEALFKVKENMDDGFESFSNFFSETF